nr:immunoglobulin light chain junction region [Macaca mulatta]
CQQNDKPPFTF